MHLVLTHPDFYIVEKPAGESFHSEQGAGFFQKTSEYFSETLYPVHRLDKVTSGLMIFARNKHAATEFGRLFNEHRQIEKYYVAIGSGKPKKKQGEIKGDMEKARGGSYKLCNSVLNPAITRFYSASLAPGVRGYILRAVTGKTHQLRVALRANSTPIVGDARYKGDAADRVYLHAFALKFNWQGENIEITLPPTQGSFFSENGFKTLLNEWQAPWQLKW